MSEYEFDALRYCQANMDRMGVMPTGQAVGALIIGEINALRAENHTLRNEARVYREQCAMADGWRDKIEGELAALLARHNALSEAVAWERESGGIIPTCEAASFESERLWRAARAEVDRLITSETSANCKGEG